VEVEIILKIRTFSILNCIYNCIYLFMNFVWDENKNSANIKKHGIDFNDALVIFENPLLIKINDRRDYQEKRWIALGKMMQLVVVVVFTIRADSIRIISIRKANRTERKIYHESLQ
jgi:uncharacterized DUF497 family protein